MATKKKPPKPYVRYSWGAFTRVCRAMERGMSTREACRQPGMPDKSAFQSWTTRSAKHLDRYVRARMALLNHEANNLLDLADEPCLDNVEVQQLRLRVDTRKWILSKLVPQYADKQQLDHKGALSIQVVTGVPERDNKP